MIDVNKSSQTSSSTPVDLTPSQFASLRSPFSDALRSMFAGNLSGGGAPTGPLVAPLSPQEQAGLTQLNFNAFNSGGLGGAQDEYLSRVIRGDFLTPESNPFLQGTIDLALDPIRKDAQRQEMMDRATFSQGGRIQGNSAFQKQRLDNIAETDRLLTNTAAAISNQNYQNERARQSEALGQANARLNAQIQSIAAIALPRMIQDLGIERGLAEFNTRMNRIVQALQIGAGVTQPTIGQSTVSESKATGAGVTLPIGAGVG